MRKEHRTRGDEGEDISTRGGGGYGATTIYYFDSQNIPKVQQTKYHNLPS